VSGIPFQKQIQAARLISREPKFGISGLGTFSLGFIGPFGRRKKFPGIGFTREGTFFAGVFEKFRLGGGGILYYFGGPHLGSGGGILFTFGGGLKF